LRFIVYSLLALLVAIQYPLWIGKGGWLHVYQLDKTVEAQRAKNEELENRNNKIAGDVNDLRQGTRAVEERARIEHGMVKENETMVQIVTSDEELPKPVAKLKQDKKDEDRDSSNSAQTKKSPKSSATEKITQ
jgi:cell division protein FtsB